jgi:hypothetical protein
VHSGFLLMKHCANYMPEACKKEDRFILKYYDYLRDSGRQARPKKRQIIGNSSKNFFSGEKHADPRGRFCNPPFRAAGLKPRVRSRQIASPTTEICPEFHSISYLLTSQKRICLYGVAGSAEPVSQIRGQLFAMFDNPVERGSPMGKHFVLIL